MSVVLSTGDVARKHQIEQIRKKPICHRMTETSFIKISLLVGEKRKLTNAEFLAEGHHRQHPFQNKSVFIFYQSLYNHS